MIAGTLEIQMLANMARLQKDMDDAKRAVGGAMADIERHVGAAKAALGGLAAGLLGGMSVAGLVNVAQKAIDAADAMNDLSQRVGISVKDLAKYELASKQSGTSMESLSKGIKGLAGNLMEHGDALKKAGISATDADGAMRQVAEVFARMPDGMEKTTLAVKLFGKSGMDLIPMLNMGAEGLDRAAEKSAKYAAAMAAMAPMADAYNDNMAELEMHNKVASMTMMNSLLPALVAITGAMADAAKNGGFLKGVMAGLDEFGNQAFDWSGNNARKGIRTLTKDLEDLQVQQARITIDIFGAKGSIQTQIEEKTKALEAARKAYYGFTDGSAGGGRGSVNPASVKPTTDALADYKALMAALKDGAGGTKAAETEFDKLVKKIGVDMAKAAAEAEAALNGYNKSQTDFIALTKTDVWAKLTVEQKAQVAVMYEARIASEQLTDSTKELAKAAIEAAKARADAINKERDAIEKYMAAESERFQKEAHDAEEVVKQAQLQYDSMGLLKSQIAEITLARLQDQTVNLTAGTEAYESLQRQIAAQQQLIGVLRNTEAKEESISMWKSIDATAHDVFVNIFEGGQSAFKKLGSVLKASLLDLLYQMTVKKWLISIGASMSGGSALADVAGGASGGNSLLGSGLSALGNSSIGSTVGGWFGGGGGAMAAANAATATGGSLAGAAYTTAAADSALAYGAAGTTAGMTGGSAAAAGGSSVLAAIPVWGWIALAAIAIASKAKGETRSGGQYAYDSNSGVASLLQGPSGGEIDGGVVKQSIAGTAGGINGLLKGMGSSAMLVGFQAGLESSDRGRGGVFSGGTLSTGATFGESGKGSNYEGTLYEQTSSHSVDSKTALENFTTDLMQGTIQALQAAGDIPKTISDMIKGVDAESLSADAAKALVTTIQTTVSGVTQLHDALETMGLKELSFDAAAGLIAAAGGMDKLGASLSTYYDKFYSAEEKTTASIKATRDAFAKLGVTMPLATDGLRDWYRAQVDSLMAMDQTVAANAQATAGALALAGAVDQIAPATDNAVSSMMAFTDNVMKMVDGIHTSVSGSIFDMQYGLKDNQGKYGMLDTVAKGYDDKMRGATDINVIADMAQREIDTINKAWALLDATQQQDKLGEMTALLTKVDEFVTQSGADAISLKKAENAELADAVATAVEAALQTLTQRLADAAITQAAATSQLAEAKREPTQVTVTVNNSTGDEVAIS